MKDDSARLLDLVGSYAIRPLMSVQSIASVHSILAGRDRLVYAAWSHFGKLLAKRGKRGQRSGGVATSPTGEAPRREGQSERVILTLSQWREIASATFVAFVFNLSVAM